MILTLLQVVFAIYICMVVLFAGLCGLALLRMGGLDNFVLLANKLSRREGDDLGFTRRNTLICMIGVVVFWPFVPLLFRKKKPESVDSGG